MISRQYLWGNKRFQEKFYFNPGDTGFKVFDTRFGKIGVAICWDQWFPEAARVMALQGAEVSAEVRCCPKFWLLLCFAWLDRHGYFEWKPRSFAFPASWARCLSVNHSSTALKKRLPHGTQYVKTAAIRRGIPLRYVVDSRGQVGNGSPRRVCGACALLFCC